MHYRIYLINIEKIHIENSREKKGGLTPGRAEGPPPRPLPPPAPATTTAAATATAAAAATEVKVQSLIAHYVRISYVFYTSIMYIIRPCHAWTTLATTVPMSPLSRRYCRRYGIKDGSRSAEDQNTCALQKVKTPSAFAGHQCQLRPLCS